MNWILEGDASKRFKCHGDAWRWAMKAAHERKARVVIRYHGGGKRQGNRDTTRSDFAANPDGSVDYRIDPTWWENR